MPGKVSDNYKIIGKDYFLMIMLIASKFKLVHIKVLSSNLVKLIENKKLRKKFSINARKFVETKFEKIK